VTREEFIGRAADAIHRHEAEKGPAIGGRRAQKLCPVWTSEIAEAALEAVGAWEKRVAADRLVTVADEDTPEEWAEAVMLLEAALDVAEG